MVLTQSIVTWMYYAITAGVVILLFRNFLRERQWQREVFYLIVLLPFLLRVLRLK